MPSRNYCHGVLCEHLIHICRNVRDICNSPINVNLRWHGKSYAQLTSGTFWLQLDPKGNFPYNRISQSSSVVPENSNGKIALCMDLWFVWKFLLLYAETFMNRWIFYICNDYFQCPWQYNKSNLPPQLWNVFLPLMWLRSTSNAVSVAVLVLQKLFFDNGRWSLWLQGCAMSESDLFHGNQKLLWHSGHSSIIVCLVLASQREKKHVWEMERGKWNWDKDWKYLPIAWVSSTLLFCIEEAFIFFLLNCSWTVMLSEENGEQEERRSSCCFFFHCTRQVFIQKMC